MSEIPFVKSLGDAIERSAAERIAGRRRRIRRRLTIGVLGFAVAATGVAAASGVFSTPEQLASSGVACYDRASLDGGASVLSPGEATPIATCRRVLHIKGPMVACAAESVAVFPGRAGTCEKLGLRPLPATYTTARAKVLKLERRVTAIESSGCIPTEQFARRVQTLLDRTPGWEGWKVDVREDLAEGPCGSVTMPGGDGQRSIEGALAADARRVTVFGTLPRALENLLYSSHGLVAQLLDASGERCYDVAGLQDLARRRLAAADRPLTFSVAGPPADVEIAGGQGDRLAEGCPIIVGVAAKDGGRELTVEIWE